MAESVYEQIAVDEAVKAGWFCRKLAWIGRRNGPDRFFAKEGRVVLIEFKRPGETARDNQADEIEELRAAGVEVYQADTHVKALRFLGVPYAP